MGFVVRDPAKYLLPDDKDGGMMMIMVVVLAIVVVLVAVVVITLISTILSPTKRLRSLSLKH